MFGFGIKILIYYLLPPLPPAVCHTNLGAIAGQAFHQRRHTAALSCPLRTTVKNREFVSNPLECPSSSESSLSLSRSA